MDRDTFIERLYQFGIGCSVHFIPLHLHPYYRDTYQLSAADLPVASQCFDQTVSIPLYSAMTDAEVERGAQAVEQLLG